MNMFTLKELSRLGIFYFVTDSAPFAIRLNPLHPQPYWCFTTLVNYYFEVSFNLRVILYIAKMS